MISGLGIERARLHDGVDLVAGAVQETGVDEDDAVAGDADALLERDGRAALLVHDADFERLGRQIQGLLYAPEQLHGCRHFFGAVHLGLDDVDAAGAAVTLCFQIVLGRQRRHHGVEKALGDLVAVGRGDRVRVHVDAGVTYQHDAATGQRERAVVAAV